MKSWKRQKYYNYLKKATNYLLEIITQFPSWQYQKYSKVVFIQLSKYFQDNGLFYESQYGFWENHSTKLATVELLDRIMSALDHNELPSSIYMDLSKAFDTLGHSILIDKLSHYGIKRNAP